MQQSTKREKCSIASHYRHICCQYCKDAYRWGNKKRGKTKNRQYRPYRIHTL